MGVSAQISKAAIQRAGPFMNGAMELLSAGLVRHVAASAEVDAFVARAKGAIEARKQAGHAMADRQRGPRVWRQNEDIALGFWIARAIRLLHRPWPHMPAPSHRIITSAHALPP